MDADITQLLQRTSITPYDPIDPTKVRVAARRRTRRGQAAGVAATTLMVAAAVPLGAQLLDQPRMAEPIVEPAPAGQRVSFDVVLHQPDEWTQPASQTEAEALRDGVPPNVIRIPTHVRVPDQGPSIDLEDGHTWLQGFGGTSAERGLARLTPDCGGGELCDGQYMEFLLVDQSGEIVLAHPFPLVTAGGGFGTSTDGSGALVGSFGETAEADVVVFRIGTTPGDRQVLVWPTEGSPFVPDSSTSPALSAEGEDLQLPAGWQVFPVGTALPDGLAPGTDNSISSSDLEALLQRHRNR